MLSVLKVNCLFHIMKMNGTESFREIQAPAVRAGLDGRAEEYAEEARYFVECRLLQRDVEVILESVSNQNFVGSVIHPKGNIAELLLKEGFAKCVDWSIALATSGPEILRAAEKYALKF